MYNSGYFIGIIAVMLLIYLAIVIPFLLTLQNAMKAVSPQNRRMSPGFVWLMMIPFLNYIMNFIVIARLSESLDEEYHSRGIYMESKPGYGVGLAYCILSLVSVLPLSFLKGLASIAALVCFIIYWVQVYNHKSRLNNMMPKQEPGMGNILDSEFRS